MKSIAKLGKRGNACNGSFRWRMNWITTNIHQAHTYWILLDHWITILKWVWPAIQVGIRPWTFQRYFFIIGLFGAPTWLYSMLIDLKTQLWGSFNIPRCLWIMLIRHPILENWSPSRRPYPIFGELDELGSGNLSHPKHSQTPPNPAFFFWSAPPAICLISKCCWRRVTGTQWDVCKVHCQSQIPCERCEKCQILNVASMVILFINIHIYITISPCSSPRKMVTYLDVPLICRKVHRSYVLRYIHLP